MIGKLIEPVTGLLDKFIEDKDQKAQLAHELATMADRHAQELALAQIEVNKAEAASGSLFKGGWRPAVGWICAIAFAYHFVLQPFFVFVLVTFNVTGLHPSDLPQFDMTSLMTVLMGMLGLGGLRTYEKKQGITK
jgi:hypothetical protein